MTKKQRDLIYGLVGGGTLVAAALLVVSARKLGLVEDPSLGIRLFGIMCGFILAAYANVIPRRLVRYEPGSDGPARRQACLRFCGWVFALAGLTNAAIWLMTPLESAALLSMAPIVLAFLLVGLRIGMPRRGEA
jgi:hypothetical protein